MWLAYDLIDVTTASVGLAEDINLATINKRIRLMITANINRYIPLLRSKCLCKIKAFNLVQTAKKCTHAATNTSKKCLSVLIPKKQKNKTTNFKCRNQNAYDFNDEYNIKQQKYSDKQ